MLLGTTVSFFIVYWYFWQLRINYPDNNKLGIVDIVYLNKFL